MQPADVLRADILEGRLPPGSVLSQTALATRLGVSRIPIRDALQQLAAERLVTVLPGKGAQVVTLSDGELAEIYDLRVLLEGDLLRRAIAVAGADDHARVAYAMARARLEAGRPGWAEGDWLFHAALYAPARRGRQVALVEELRRTCVVQAAHYERLADRTPDWLDHHDALYRAFVDGDAERALGELRQHLQAAHDHLIALRATP